MKGKKENPKKSIDTKRKGFYAALYSCIGVMAIIAVVLAYNNVSQSQKRVKDQAQNEKIQQESEQVNVSKEKPLAKLDENNSMESASVDGELSSGIIYGSESEISKKKKDNEEKENIETNENENKEEEIKDNKTKDNESDSKGKDIEKEKTDSDKKETKKQDKDPEDIKEKDDEEKENTETNENENKEAIVIPVEDSQNDDTVEIILDDSMEKSVNTLFTSFEDGDRMGWPVAGEIVMDFSTDKLIYDKTLEQYRTNETLCIAAPVATQVKAAAEGIVKEVIETKEMGNKVTIDHGNGWMTTYSQLQENVLVSVGDVVKAGQVIGGIGNPSIYAISLGNHLGFEVRKDDIAINPNEILVE